MFTPDKVQPRFPPGGPPPLPDARGAPLMQTLLPQRSAWPPPSPREFKNAPDHIPLDAREAYRAAVEAVEALNAARLREEELLGNIANLMKVNASLRMQLKSAERQLKSGASVGPVPRPAERSPAADAADAYAAPTADAADAADASDASEAPEVPPEPLPPESPPAAIGLSAAAPATPTPLPLALVPKPEGDAYSAVAAYAAEARSIASPSNPADETPTGLELSPAASSSLDGPESSPRSGRHFAIARVPTPRCNQNADCDIEGFTERDGPPGPPSLNFGPGRSPGLRRSRLSRLLVRRKSGILSPRG